MLLTCSRMCQANLQLSQLNVFTYYFQNKVDEAVLVKKKISESYEFDYLKSFRVAFVHEPNIVSSIMKKNKTDFSASFIQQLMDQIGVFLKMINRNDN